MKFKDPMKEDLFQKFRKHFPNTKNIVLLILKGHLIIEEEMNELISLASLNSKKLERAKLTYFQKICLLTALYPTRLHDTFYSIELLNELRNKIAHNLDHKETNFLIERFLKTLEDQERLDEYKEEPIYKRLKSSIAFLCGGISGIKVGITMGMEENKI